MSPTVKNSSEKEQLKSLVNLSFWAALISVGAWIALPIGAVPITLQTMFVLAAGLNLGPKYGFMAAGLYVVAGLAGLPILSAGMAGLGAVKSPTAGFLLSFPLMAFIAGFAHPRATTDFSWLKGVGWCGLATLALYGAGSLGLHINAKLSWPKAWLLLIAFLPGDALKIFLALSLTRYLSPKARKND